MLRDKSNRAILVQFITGLALLAIVADLNRAELVNWLTVIVALAGVTNIVMAITDYLNRKS